jgi:hypothetical protein
MPTIQIWINNEDIMTLKRLKAYLEYEQDERFKGKAWRWHTYAGRRERRILRKRINDSYVYRQALDLFWNELERKVLDFEELKGYRY